VDPQTGPLQLLEDAMFDKLERLTGKPRHPRRYPEMWSGNGGHLPDFQLVFSETPVPDTQLILWSRGRCLY
jgi:hypothetical protein